MEKNKPAHNQTFIETHPKGTFCYRCGTTKKEQQKEKSGCGVGYGTIFEAHEWNDETIEVETQVLSVK